MKIVADKDLTLVEELFSRFGELVLLPGRGIENRHLTDADALLVRSTTKVSEKLLTNTSLKFVGSATTGIDHISMNELNQRGINFSDAKGCNANAVSDYCLSAIANLFSKTIKNDKSLTVGIIGHGSIGSLLARKMKALNWDTLIYDPPQSEEIIDQPDPVSYGQLENMNTCDVISIHVPFTTSGKYPTKRLIDKKFLSSLSDNTALINTSRGGVVDEESLLELMSDRPSLLSVIDVWAGEPLCNTELVEKSYFATPHIAGYSENAKRTASLRIFAEFCRCFDFSSADVTGQYLQTGTLKVEDNASNFLGVLNEVLPIMDVSSQFKQLIKTQGQSKRAGIFDMLRLKFSGRREFCEYVAPGNICRGGAKFLHAAGFNR